MDTEYEPIQGVGTYEVDGEARGASFVDDLPGNFTLFEDGGDDVIIEGGSEVVVTYEATAPDEEGTHTIEGSMAVDTPDGTDAHYDYSQDVVVAEEEEEPPEEEGELSVDSVDATPITEGDDATFDVTVNNSGEDEATADVGVEIDTPEGDYSASDDVTVGAGETETVSLTVDTSDLPAGTYDYEITVDGEEAYDGTLTVREDANALITGELTDRQQNAIDSDVAGDLEVTVYDRESDRYFFTNVPLSEFDDLAEENDLVDSAGFTPGEPDVYDIELALIEDTAQYEFTVNDPENRFFTFDGVTEELEGGQNDDLNFRLERVEDADRLTILADGELDRITGDIEDGDVPIDPDPERLGQETVDIDESVEADVFVETMDNEDFGTDLGELAPFEDTVHYDAEIVDGVDAGQNVNVVVDPVQSDTDEDGLTDFEISLDLGTHDADDFSDNIEVELEFYAQSDNTAYDTLTIIFVPEIGDTGTISGEVDEIRQDRMIGVQDDRQSNIQPIANVPVHAVQFDDLMENMASINDGAALEEVPAEVGGENVIGHSPENVRIADGDQFRVVTYEDNEEIIQDPRADYLVHTSSDTEVVQNETSIGFDVHETEGDTGELIGVSFLEPDDYQVQQLVEVTLEDQTTEVLWKNVSLDTAGGTHATPDALFSPTEDLTFDAVDERYEDDRVIPTDYTNEHGDFELLNMPTHEEYVVIAGAGDAVSADDPEDRVGFANFRGYSVVPVEPNAEVGALQYNVDLSVQQYTPDVDLNYYIDVKAQDPESGEFTKWTALPTGEETIVQFEVFLAEVGADEDERQPAGEVELDAELIEDNGFSNVGDLVDDTVTTNADGIATTTFVAHDMGFTGETNVTASTIEETDRDGQRFFAEGGDQATIEVFEDAQITGDVVDNEDTLIPNADVTLYVIDEATGTLDYVDDTNTGDDGSYSFVDVRTGLDYRVVAEDEHGHTGFNEGQLKDLPAGTTNADIVIPDAVAPEGVLVTEIEPAEDVTADQGDTVTVTATVTNTGVGLENQDVAFYLAGDEVASEGVSLGSGETETVTFELDTSDLAGDYDWYVSTDDDVSDTWTLTVDEVEDDYPVDEDVYYAIAGFTGDDSMVTGADIAAAQNQLIVDGDNEIDGVTFTGADIAALHNDLVA
ncbi:CARDB domain-containing protein [Natronobeatus ordinarius]|uniref:CARDB domain-containing protein n=1 Tax=Natronobeatus ordinarius TaxID=2963433 RepID=UPI0020CE088A|nr:CARDB domain-containing protein [Natronobeatus ordinarius]